jgi:hypothetical protein
MSQLIARSALFSSKRLSNQWSVFGCGAFAARQRHHPQPGSVLAPGTAGNLITLLQMPTQSGIRCTELRGTVLCSRSSAFGRLRKKMVTVSASSPLSAQTCCSCVSPGGRYQNTDSARERRTWRLDWNRLAQTHPWSLEAGWPSSRDEVRSSLQIE